MKKILIIFICFFSISIFSQTPETVSTVTEILPSQGFSFNSLWRGVIGMISLLIIAFLFSSNKKAIDWKTVGLGVALQLLIAIGVLKVSFIQKAFEWVGSLFVSVLDYTRAGSKFLFEGLVVDMDTFGFIFAFHLIQVARTSVSVGHIVGRYSFRRKEVEQMSRPQYQNLYL